MSKPKTETCPEPNEKLWDAINRYVSALKVLEARRAHKEMMNADYIDAVEAAGREIDRVAAALSAPQQGVDPYLQTR
jgi:intein/homing endonuclease